MPFQNDGPILSILADDSVFSRNIIPFPGIAENETDSLILDVQISDFQRKVIVVFARVAQKALALDGRSITDDLTEDTVYRFQREVVVFVGVIDEVMRYWRSDI